MKKRRNPRDDTGRCPEQERMVPSTYWNNSAPWESQLSGQVPADGCARVSPHCNPDGSTWEELIERRKELPPL